MQESLPKSHDPSNAVPNRPGDTAARNAGLLLIATALITLAAVGARVMAGADQATLVESLAAIAESRLVYGFGGAARVCRLPSRRAHACKESSRSADSVTGWRRGWQLRTVRRWSGHGGDLSLAGGRSVESLVIGDFVGPEDRRRWTDGWRVGSAGSAGRRNGTAAERLARMLQKGLDDARV